MNTLRKRYVDNPNCIVQKIFISFLDVYGHIHMFHALQQITACAQKKGVDNDRFGGGNFQNSNHEN